MDLDNVWSYLKTHGDDGWELRPVSRRSFYVLEVLEREQLQITFFVVVPTPPSRSMDRR
jgi:hypothetical protein